MDTEKLIKLLNLTMSPNDHECLAAIRKVNNMLRENNLMYDSLVSPPAAEKKTEPKATQKQESGMPVEKAFEHLLASKHLNGKSREFVEGLKEYFEEHKTLTAKQISALEGIAIRIFKLDKEAA